MKNRLNRILIIGLLFLATSTAHAELIELQQLSGFFYSESLDSSSLEYTEIGNLQDEFSGAGLSVTFQNSLDTENMGSVSWTFSNDTGSQLDNAWFFVFLDAEIDQAINTFYNEYGALASVIGAGADDEAADSWEIDEPGYVFGDIYDNLLAGVLDNSNDVSEALQDDVSLALGFDLGSLVAGATVTGLFELSRLDIGGLAHFDDDSADAFYFNGTVHVDDGASASVPEPSVPLLMAGPLLFIYFRQRSNS
jgi:hypothetical protein